MNKPQPNHDELEKRVHVELRREMEAVQPPPQLHFDAIAPQVAHRRRQRMITKRIGAVASTAVALLIIGLAVIGFWLMTRAGNVPMPATNPNNGKNQQDDAAPAAYPPPDNENGETLPGPTVTSTPFPMMEGYPAPGEEEPQGEMAPTDFPPTMPPPLTPVSGGAQQYDGLETGYAFSYPAAWNLETVQQNCCDRPDTFLRFNTGADIRPVVEPMNSGDVVLHMTFAPLDGLANADPYAYVDVTQDPQRQVETILQPQAMEINEWPVAASIYRPLDTAEVPFTTDENGELVYPEQPEAHELVLMAVQTPDALIEMRGFAALDEGNGLYAEMVALVRSLRVSSNSGGTPHEIEGQGLVVEIPAGWQISALDNRVFFSSALNPQPDEPLAVTLQYAFPESNPKTITETLAMLPWADLREVETPFALTSRPDITWAMYQIFEDERPYLVLTGVIPHPRTRIAGDYLLAYALVPVENLDGFRPMMQQIIRSIRPAED